MGEFLKWLRRILDERGTGEPIDAWRARSR
jgi:hypothetical protein